MNELQVVEHYGEVSRVLRHVRPLSADQVAERVIQLYRRHSAEVTGVMDGAIRDHASDIREGKLPATCAILLAIPESYKKAAAVRSENRRARWKVSSTPTGGGESAEGRQRLELPPWLTTEGRSEHANATVPPKRDRWTGLHKQTQSGR